jgi:hypothetical protein
MMQLTLDGSLQGVQIGGGNDPYHGGLSAQASRRRASLCSSEVGLYL